MLVLSRKKSERVIIDGHIAITVVEIRGDKVRLGIEAPDDVLVHREEVQLLIDAAQLNEQIDQYYTDHGEPVG